VIAAEPKGADEEMKALPCTAIPLIDHTLEAAIVKPKTAGAPSTPRSGR
jgi:hypothetical protein